MIDPGGTGADAERAPGDRASPPGDPDAIGDDDVLIAVAGAQAGAAIGRVIAAGSRAAGLLDRRVIVGAEDPCGECEVCRRGGAPACPAARVRPAAPGARRLRAAARWAVPLEAGLAALPAPSGAAAAGDAALAYTLYARLGPGPREPVVIVGASPVTRFLVEIVHAKGALPAVVAERDDALTAWARERGAAVAIAPRGGPLGSARAAVAAALAPHGAAARPWRIAAVTAAAAATAIGIAGPRAILAAHLARGQAPPALPGDLLAREVTLLGVAGPHPDLFVETAALCVRGDIDLAGGTLAVLAEDQAGEAADDLLRARVVVG